VSSDGSRPSGAGGGCLVLSRPLSGRELQVLADLRDFRGGGWARPMDVGGRSRSWHSRVLKGLVEKGLVERRERSAWLSLRGSWVYRITAEGREYVRIE
jgi:DNA-binding MarR family transcriptional regulator